jgi:hypothetical protein
MDREPPFKKVKAQTIMRSPPLPERNVACDQSSNYRDKCLRERLNVELTRLHCFSPPDAASPALGDVGGDAPRRRGEPLSRVTVGLALASMQANLKVYAAARQAV